MELAVDALEDNESVSFLCSAFNETSHYSLLHQICCQNEVICKLFNK